MNFLFEVEFYEDGKWNHYSTYNNEAGAYEAIKKIECPYRIIKIIKEVIMVDEKYYKKFYRKEENPYILCNIQEKIS